jgi:putative membrane protein
MSRIHFNRHFNWRMLLVRTLVNALALMVIVILPDIRFVDRTLLSILVIAIILGILNAVVKPIIQFLTLRFIFITYGFAVVIINTVILLLLDFIVKDRFAVDSLFWAIIGAALMGLVSSFFENLLGLQVPIFPDDAGELPELESDLAKVFERKIIAGVMSPDEELIEEVPLPGAGNDQIAEEGATGDPPPDEGATVTAEPTAAAEATVTTIPAAIEESETPAETASTKGDER